MQHGITKLRDLNYDTFLAIYIYNTDNSLKQT